MGGGEGFGPAGVGVQGFMMVASHYGKLLKGSVSWSRWAVLVTLAVAGDEPFRMRLPIVFLNLLDASTAQRGSRRTRDDRTPFVRQQQMAAWFDVPRPNISRWLRYWLAGDWANLLSLHSPEVLTAELVERIVTVLATFPTWSTAQVYQHLRQQGVTVTQVPVQQAAEQSGWQRLRQTLAERYDLNGAEPRVRDEWLVAQLLAQVEELLARLESGQLLPQEERLACADLMALTTATGTPLSAPVKTLPWLLRVEQLVLGQWQTHRACSRLPRRLRKGLSLHSLLPGRPTQNP